MMLKEMFFSNLFKKQLKFLITVLSITALAHEYLGNIIKANEAFELGVWIGQSFFNGK